MFWLSQKELIQWIGKFDMNVELRKNLFFTYFTLFEIKVSGKTRNRASDAVETWSIN